MNLFAHRRWLVVPIQAASSAAIALALCGIIASPVAWGQSPSLDAAANNPGGTGYTSNPYIPGQQLIPGSRIAPTQASRPAGWPGGPAADDPPPPPRRKRFASAFGSAAAPGTQPAAAGQPGVAAPQAIAGQPAAGQPSAALPPGAVAQPGFAAGPAVAAQSAVATQAPAAPVAASQPAGTANLNNALGGALPPGAQVGPPALGAAVGVATTGGSVALLPAVAPPPVTGAMPGAATPGAAAGDGDTAGTDSAAGSGNGDTVLVASALTTPAYPAGDEKRAPVPFRIPATFTGAEIIAWVGPEVILASDVLPDANRTLQKAMEQAQARGQHLPSPEEAENVRKIYMAKFLDKLIETKLVIVEGRRLIPKEAWGKIEKQFDTQFDKDYLPRMFEAEDCKSRTELDLKLRKSGSSLLGMKRQSMESSFAAYFIEEKTKDEREITHEEMHAFYRAHLADYETPAKVRWEHLMARFDKFSTKADAYQAIASWGNEVVGGKPFTDVAQAHSQDATASDGGVHTWTAKGSLASEVIDEAIFTLPVGQLSQILEDDRGFHIIRVLERHDLEVTPFTEKQADIVKKIREERVTDKRNDYRAKLRAKIPVWNIFEEADKMREQAMALQAVKKSANEPSTR